MIGEANLDMRRGEARFVFGAEHAGAHVERIDHAARHGDGGLAGADELDRFRFDLAGGARAELLPVTGGDGRVRDLEELTPQGLHPARSITAPRTWPALFGIANADPNA